MHKLLFNNLTKTKQYLFSVTVIIIVAAICFLFSDVMGYRVAALVLLVTVSLLAMIFDVLPVLFSAVLSALVWDFFFIPPRFTIHVDTTEDTILLVMYFVIALINAVLTYKIRQIEKDARLKDEKANSVKLYNTILNSLSHELRTPIAAIIGATDNLQTNRNLSKENHEQLLAEIAKGALRLDQQVENLLNISRLESGHIQPKPDWCDVEELIYRVVQSVEENNKSRKIGISIKPGLPYCSIDKGMLEQILYNLLNNAAIHTSAECTISISAVCHVDILQIDIEDSGNTLIDTEAKDILNKFSRNNNSKTTRSGLGLSIVKGFTDALAGNVVLERSSLGGAKFIVSLPVKSNRFEKI